MNVSIHIHYECNDNKIMRRGSFRVSSKKREQVAYDFWKWIKKESPYSVKLEKVICDGEDITQMVKEIDEAPLV
jgi:hypothetical protein